MAEQARELAELDEAELQEVSEGESGDSQNERLLGPSRGRGLTVATLRVMPFVAGLLLMAVVGLAVGRSSSGLSARVQSQPAVVGLDEESDPCFGHPFLHIDKLLVNNLGGHGPQVDSPEGLIYRATAHHSGLGGVRTVELHVHAVSETEFVHDVSEGIDLGDSYSPAWAKANGISGHFATVNIKPGLNVTLKVHAYDPLERKVFTVPSTAITFFDLDTGDDGHSAEFLKIKGYKHYYTTNTTEIEKSWDEKHGTAVFKATKKGTGEDNPVDPLQLTVLQKNRVVSFEFEETRTLTFEIGCTEGKTARVFNFVLRPALRCADTMLPNNRLIPATDPFSPVRIVQNSAGPLTLPVASWALCMLFLASQSRT